MRYVACNLVIKVYHVLGDFESEGDPCGLDEHHGVGVEQALRGVTVNLNDVIPETDAPLGRLAPCSDLREKYVCTLVSVSFLVPSNLSVNTFFSSNPLWPCPQQ